MSKPTLLSTDGKIDKMEIQSPKRFGKSVRQRLITEFYEKQGFKVLLVNHNTKFPL